MTWILALFIGGIMLIASEFVLPGAIMGIMGFCCIIGSIFLGWNKFPEYGFIIAIGEALGTIAILIFGFWAMANTRLGNLFVMRGVQRKEDGYSGPAQSPDLVGQVAVAHTPLRPAGTLMLNDERIDAVSNGTYIDRGTQVRIIQVEGHRVVVEENIPEAETAGS
jgi:membrane-bound serine protease (ClpP class)